MFIRIQHYLIDFLRRNLQPQEIYILGIIRVVALVAFLRKHLLVFLGKVSVSVYAPCRLRLQPLQSLNGYEEIKRERDRLSAEKWTLINQGEEHIEIIFYLI